MVICLELFSENSYSFRCFQSDGEFSPNPRRRYREKIGVRYLCILTVTLLHTFKL